MARAERVTSGSMVPTMIARMVRHLDGRPADIPSLRAIAYGGSRTPRSVLEQALRAFPQVDFVHGYGLAETSAGITALSAEEHREALDSRDPRIAGLLGSAGRVVDGAEMQIRDPLGTVLGPDQEGELWVRGAEVSGEYAGLGSVLDADGWFPTRDLAHLDGDGYLFVHGRADDTIIRGGADELTAFVRQRLRGSRTPDEIRFVDDLPYTDTGKVHRRSLVTQLSSAA